MLTNKNYVLKTICYQEYAILAITFASLDELYGDYVS